MQGAINLKILFIGDIMGRPGRRAVNELLSQIIAANEINFVIANGENAAGGKGITPETAYELFSYGINVLTGGNHIFSKKESFNFINNEQRIIRPANYPDTKEVPGKGWGVYEVNNYFKIGIVNVCGRIFMDPLDCPFRTAQKIVNDIKQQTNNIIVDIHAEATSEKIAFKWYMDGEVSAVIGTHTHVQTADETVTPSGTAYITDVGMTGAFDSVIGVKKDPIVKAFINCLPAAHTIANGDVKLCGVIIDINPITGRAIHIKRICNILKENE